MACHKRCAHGFDSQPQRTSASDFYAATCAVQGSLRGALDTGLLRDPATGATHLGVAVGLAHDIACAMLHLHSDGILHGDLKVSMRVCWGRLLQPSRRGCVWLLAR